MLVRPVMKRLFFAWKNKEKRLVSLARLIIIVLSDQRMFLKSRKTVPIKAVSEGAKFRTVALLLSMKHKTCEVWS